MKYLVRFSEVGVSLALSARSLKCEVIDASSSGSTSAHSPPSISEEAASQAVGLTEQHEQDVDDSDNSLLCHGVQWKVVDGFLKTGDACHDLEHTSCGEMMWMRCVGHHSIIGCCHFHPIC